ncbi:hypothetical protein BX659_1575 [Orenia metallireducens]|uniref:Uncharacterized protein n=1 Tax=Orenia metallireducens TaxID=1413210 RepID=A0A285IIE6_9FIRM|nr:hypothetical protein [Orenia metallireducens]PRX17190.1 hypothetical protein BX659_1575 [Orenia metallireducens]SNY47739.1 hypothetical protein SAMN06265827_1575 [Orenia metallireducens]
MNKANDQRATVKNPTSPDFQANNNNKSNQLNSNNYRYQGGGELSIKDFINKLELEDKINRTEIAKYIQKELNTDTVDGMYFLDDNGYLYFSIIASKAFWIFSFAPFNSRINEKISIDYYRLSEIRNVKKNIIIESSYSTKSDEQIKKLTIDIVPGEYIDRITLSQELETVPSSNQDKFALNLLNGECKGINSLNKFYYSLIKALNN